MFASLPKFFANFPEKLQKTLNLLVSNIEYYYLLAHPLINDKEIFTYFKFEPSFFGNEENKTTKPKLILEESLPLIRKGSSSFQIKQDLLFSFRILFLLLKQLVQKNVEGVSSGKIDLSYLLKGISMNHFYFLNENKDSLVYDEKDISTQPRHTMKLSSSLEFSKEIPNEFFEEINLFVKQKVVQLLRRLILQ